MTARVEHIAGQTYHGRKGGVKNAFRYSVDYVLTDAESDVRTPWFFGRNTGALVGLHDVDHGGPPKGGAGAEWVRRVLSENGIMLHRRIDLLAQPRILGHVFNPVSFWLGYDGFDDLCVVIAEVTNTFGDRHSYICANPDLRPISKSDALVAKKIFHVSPFQPVGGEYTFHFDINPDAILIHIAFDSNESGVVATLSGSRKPLDNKSLLQMLFRRPFGSRRVLALIHFQALKLWWKGVAYRPRPEPPEHEVSRG